jgi:hypothetical protein
MIRFARADFDHIGIPTDQEKAGATWLEADRVWVTNPRHHPLNIEWVRYAPDSPMHPRLKEGLHLAYRVDSLEAALQGEDVLVPPLDLGNGFARIAFIEVDGAVVELMEYRDRSETGWIPTPD